MRVNKKPDYGAISKRSIKKDFFSEEIHIRKEKIPEKRNLPKITATEKVQHLEQYEAADTPCRISSINPNCQYAKYAKFFVGKLVKLVNKTGVGDSTTGWYEFLFDEDRKALNEAAGWSDRKNRYLLERPKFK